jgi:hypothetical protein
MLPNFARQDSQRGAPEWICIDGPSWCCDEWIYFFNNFMFVVDFLGWWTQRLQSTKFRWLSTRKSVRRWEKSLSSSLFLPHHQHPSFIMTIMTSSTIIIIFVLFVY